MRFEVRSFFWCAFKSLCTTAESVPSSNLAFLFAASIAWALSWTSLNVWYLWLPTAASECSYCTDHTLAIAECIVQMCMHWSHSGYRQKCCNLLSYWLQGTYSIHSRECVLLLTVLRKTATCLVSMILFVWKRIFVCSLYTFIHRSWSRIPPSVPNCSWFHWNGSKTISIKQEVYNHIHSSHDPKCDAVQCMV